MRKTYEIYGGIEMSLEIFTLEKEHLLTKILRHHPEVQTRYSTVVIHFDSMNDEYMHYHGSEYNIPGDILETELQNLYNAHNGQIRGEVFIIGTNECHELRKIKLGEQFSVESS